MELGSLRHRVRIEEPSAAIPDGEGGFTQTWTAVTPAEWWAAIEKASQRASERRFASTVIAQATHMLNGRFHAGLTTQSRVTWTDRAGVVHQANVLDVDDTDSRGQESVILVSEIVR